MLSEENSFDLSWWWQQAVSDMLLGIGSEICHTIENKLWLLEPQFWNKDIAALQNIYDITVKW